MSPYSIPKLEMTEEEEEDEITLHQSFMREALAMASLALSTSETPVGCVFVHDGAIIGRGMNATNRSRNGTRHAEFLGLEDVLRAEVSDSEEGEDDGGSEEGGGGDEGGNGERDAEGKDEKVATEKEKTSEKISRRKKQKYTPSILRECDLYVTVEPCIMCASLLRQVGIRRVFFGAGNEKFGGTGGVLSVHLRNGKAAGTMIDEKGDGKGEMEGGGDREGEGDYEVSGGWMREEAIVVLRRFYVQENERAPEPRSKKDRVLKLEVEPIAEETKVGEG